MNTLETPARAVLAQLEQDTRSGASQLALVTLRNLQAYVAREPHPARELGPLLEALACARPSMRVIGNTITRLQEKLSQQPGKATQVIAELITALETATGDLVRHARTLIKPGDTLLTHSASSVVIRLFTELAAEGFEFSVICTQSSPGFEGHTLARELDRLGVPVTLITDAEMGLFVPQADLVLTGCDCWLADHHFLNKSGTLLLALAARHFGKPFWVLADTFRDSPETAGAIRLEEMAAGELKAPEGARITVRNVYFEPIPDTLISGRVSEQGVFSCPTEPPQ